MRGIEMKTCNCGNPDFGFDCVCDHVKNYPGDMEFSCEYCGLYTASNPRCSKCECDTEDVIINQEEGGFDD